MLLAKQGRIAAWLQSRVGVGPDNLLPSVRCGLEAALLACFANAHNTDLATLLVGKRSATTSPLGYPITAADMGVQDVRMSQQTEQLMQRVEVNGLLDCGSCSPQECARQAVELVARGYRAIKVKVCIDSHTIRFYI